MVFPLTLLLQWEPPWDIVQLSGVRQVNKNLGTNTVSLMSDYMPKMYRYTPEDKSNKFTSPKKSFEEHLS